MSIKYLGAVSALAVATAFAGGAQAQVQDWSGFYVGGYVGQSEANQEDGERLVFDTDQDGDYGDTVFTGAGDDAFSPGSCDGFARGPTPADGCDGDDDGNEFGGRVGYDWQMGQFVVGVLGEFGSVDATDSVTSYSTTPAFYTFTREIENMAAVRARAGFVAGPVLLYATAGLATAEVTNSFDTSNGANAFPIQEDDDRADGTQIGLGAEWMFSNRFSVGLEYLRTSLDAGDYTVRAGDSGTTPDTNPFLLVDPTGTDLRRSNEDFDVDSIRLTAAFRF